MQRSSVRELAEALRPRYQRASRPDKTRILEQFCAATGYHRAYARALLRADYSTQQGGPRGGRPRQYGPEELGLLRACWELADQICGKRLGPFLPELLDRLAGCGALPAELSPAVVARVARMSPATVDRLLRPSRAGWPRRGLGTTKPGTLLKAQVPIRTFADWDEAQPGFLEMDLVAHCGASGAGSSCSP